MKQNYPRYVYKR